MNKSEAGRLGYLKSKDTQERIRKDKNKQKIYEYYKSPSLCKNCSNRLSFEKRRNRFCSISCSNIFRKSKINTCLSCQSKIKSKKYCSNKCQKDYEWQQIVKEIESGIRKCNKRYVIYKDGYKCSICGISEWLGEPISLDLDHIDGKSDNDFYSNLRLLCPNCHSQTDTYKGRNKGSARSYRRLRYIQGKSF